MKGFGGLALVGSCTIPENPREGCCLIEMGDDGVGMDWGSFLGRSIVRRVKWEGWYASICICICIDQNYFGGVFDLTHRSVAVGRILYRR